MAVSAKVAVGKGHEMERRSQEFDMGQLLLGDCRDLLKEIKDKTVDLVLTDPPYFIDGMGDDWDSESLEKKVKKAGVIGGRPIGMKFSSSQGYSFQEFLMPVFSECFRILKPGGFLVSFSQARLFHRMAVAAEDNGFEIRDMLAWHHNGQAKAFTQDHFVRKNTSLSDEEKAAIIKSLDGRKTPQLKPQLEPMILAQRPREGTFVENWMSYRVGLIDTRISLDGTFPGNLMPVRKPGKLEKGVENEHLTVKPIKLLEHIIRLLTIPGALVCDPFVGSGSTAVAAARSERRFVVMDRDPKYFDISSRRIDRAISSDSQDDDLLI